MDFALPPPPTEEEWIHSIQRVPSLDLSGKYTKKTNYWELWDKWVEAGTGHI